jgi:hypothetical protein
MRSILDANFRYTPSDQTDIRKTFARARREMRRQQKDTDGRIAQEPSKSVNNVTPMFRAARRAAS